MLRNIYFRSASIILFLWWLYLFFNTQFIVVYDSSGYEAAGKMIAHQGWAEFLRNGPQREPMFPWLISLSMRLGDWWGVSYGYPLKMIGLFFLSLTMIFSYRLMRMLSISRWLACLFVFYLGVSPTMSTSSMRLWSEFAAYPWVVLAVIWTIKSWGLLQKPSEGRKGDLKIVGHAAMVALMFLGVMSVKAITEGVLLLYLWPFYWRAFSCCRSGNFIKARQVAVFCLIVLAIFEGAVCGWRACNYYYNGEFAFTNRGDWALYGNTARRMQPLTLKRLGAAAAYVPPMGICPSLFGGDDCDFWSARYSDDLIAQKRAALSAQGIGGDAASKYFINSSMKMLLSNPLQAALLMFIEAHKMFFWEPITSFEVYPDWLEKIFFSAMFFNAMMAIAAFLSWISCVFAFFSLCRCIRKSGLPGIEKDAALLWTFNFIFWYMALYSLYFILDRYSYPIISLYVVLIAFLTHRIIKVFVK
jgi:hypothetical protein